MKDKIAVSSQSIERAAEYVGILNGVIYRIPPRMGGSESASFSIPHRRPPMQPAQGHAAVAARSKLGEPLAVIPAVAPDVVERLVPSAADGHDAERPPSVDQETGSENDQQAAKLFKRDGNEPLRAGHPDLWRLLVAGTCLEGSSFDART